MYQPFLNLEPVKFRFCCWQHVAQFGLQLGQNPQVYGMDPGPEYRHQLAATLPVFPPPQQEFDKPPKWNRNPPCHSVVKRNNHILINAKKPMGKDHIKTRPKLSSVIHRPTHTRSAVKICFVLLNFEKRVNVVIITGSAWVGPVDHSLLVYSSLFKSIFC